MFQKLYEIPENLICPDIECFFVIKIEAHTKGTEPPSIREMLFHAKATTTELMALVGEVHSVSTES